MSTREAYVRDGADDRVTRARATLAERGDDLLAEFSAKLAVA